MVRVSDIQDKLLHLIGWEQNYDTSDLKISDSLTTSESGIYFQQIHPLLTLQNMSCIAPDFKNMKFEQYDRDKVYNKGQVVECNGKLYKALRDLTYVSPDGNLIDDPSFEDFGIDGDIVHANDSIDNINLYGKIIGPRAFDSLDSESYAPDKSVTSATKAPTRIARSGKLGLYINTKCRIATKQYRLQAGKYRFKIFAKFIGNLRDYPTTDTTIFKLGIAIEKPNSTHDKFLYSDGIELKVGEDFKECYYDFELENAENVNLLINTEDSYSYPAGAIVFDDMSLYRERDLAQVSAWWEETNPFSEWLESKTKASIQKAIMRFCNEKIAQGTYKTLCENRTLFDGTGRMVDVVKNKKNLVGFEIVPIRANGVTTKINKIGLQFTEPGVYTLYLMHSSRDAPIKTLNLSTFRRNSIEWIEVEDLYLPYQSKDNDAGGSWYLCYFQSRLINGSQAIRKDKDWSKEPCNSCSRKEYLAWAAWSKYIEIHPFFVNEELVNANRGTVHLWDVENNQYTYDNNYGINLELTISCDITDFIIEQRMLFQDVIAKQVAVDMLREFAYNANVRTNRHSINASRLDILYEIDGDSSSMKKSGLNYQLDMAFKAIKLSTEGVDRVCLPCKNNGIKYRAV